MKFIIGFHGSVPRGTVGKLKEVLRTQLPVDMAEEVILERPSCVVEDILGRERWYVTIIAFFGTAPEEANVLRQIVESVIIEPVRIIYEINLQFGLTTPPMPSRVPVVEEEP